MYVSKCAPLDLNLGPSQLRYTAGPQSGTFQAQYAPLDLKSQIECQRICQIKYQIKWKKIY
jgi:uncharacterized protein with FMN-binding domain